MSETSKNRSDRDDEDLEREIRSDRKFSLAEAIGRMAGGGLLKGASPVSRKRQAELVLEECLKDHLVDAEGILRIVLLRRVTESQILLELNYEQPLAALTSYCERILASEARLQRFVTEVDAEWGRVYYERPHFQREGRPPDPDDPYTISSVQRKLTRLLEILSDQ